MAMKRYVIERDIATISGPSSPLGTIALLVVSFPARPEPTTQRAVAEDLGATTP